MADDNFEFLKMIHELQSTSKSLRDALALEAASSNSGFIALPLNVVRAMTTLLVMQEQVVKHFTEQSSEVLDKLEELSGNLKRDTEEQSQ